MQRSSASIIFTLLLCVFTGTGRAAEFCVTNGVELDNALGTAESNGEDDVIKLHTGTYQADVFSFEYNAATVSGGDDNDLTIIGGYSDFFGNPCGQLLVDDPLLTLLDANGSRRALKIDVRENSNVSVRLLSFVNGNAAGNYGGGLYINALDGSSGTLTVESNAFIDNVAQYGGGLSVASRAGGFGPLRVIGNLFVGNHASSDGNIAAANLANLDNQGDVLKRIYFTNNTVVDNVAETSQSYATAVQLYGPVGRYVYNNNLWGNSGSDLLVYAPSTTSNNEYDLYANNIGNRIGETPDFDIGNMSVQPVFEGDDPYDYTPVRTSPLVDAGISPAVDDTNWYLTNRDLRDRTRVIGPAVDIGAFENERIFRDGFEAAQPL